MSLSPEAINQSVFTAALFLAIISIPKLLALTGWYCYKMLVFLSLDRIAKSKTLQRVAPKEGTSELLKKQAEDPKLRLKTTMEAFGDWMKSIRDPLIEAFAAVVILFLLIPVYSDIAVWLVRVLIIIVAIMILGVALAVGLWRYANRMILKHPSEFQGQEDTSEKSS